MAPTFLLNDSMMAVLLLFLTLYIAVVTQLARHEMEKGGPCMARWAPLGILITFLLALTWLKLGPPVNWEWPLMFLWFFWPLFFAIFVAIVAGMKLGRAKANAPAAIGLLISNLLFIQACFAWPGVGLLIGNPRFLQTAFTESGCGFNPWISLFLLALWPVNRLLARWFHAS